MAKRIYVADDEANIRNLIQSFLANEGFEVQVFGSGDSLLAALYRQPADLVILDVMMPGLDGLAVTSRLRQQSTIPIIIVSARDSELDRITGIALGSDDYLTKPFSPIELVARVKALFRRLEMDRGGQVSRQLALGNMTLNRDARAIAVQGQLLEVTPTEFALLDYLLTRTGQAVSREELLREVWQFDFATDSRATDDLVKRLRRKLAAAGSEVLIESVWGFGFRLSVAAADPGSSGAGPGRGERET